ncbi:MAG: outer membrane lipoprotein-sorting protein [Lentisphaerae bacterium]|nr:outer membrane lipoprotein-sorting protein [Lentisphaerota bacterium]MCP4103761.1 outer membrane lipoprotein-sorting protein [Lentisphaerota bacterium]
MKKVMLLLVVAASVNCSLFAVEDASLQTSAKKEARPAILSYLATMDIIRKMEKAVNPRGVAKDIKSYVATYNAELKMQQISMKMINKFKAPNKIRTSIKIKGIPATIEAFDGKQAWSMVEGMGVREIIGPQLEFMKLSAKMSNFANNTKDIFEKVEVLKKTEIINGVSCYKVICYCPKELNLPPVVVFADMKTYFVKKSIMTVQTSMGKILTESEFSDYKNAGGIIIAHKMTTSSMGITFTAELESMKTNCNIQDSDFKKPENGNEMGNGGKKI